MGGPSIDRGVIDNFKVIDSHDGRSIQGDLPRWCHYYVAPTKFFTIFQRLVHHIMHCQANIQTLWWNLDEHTITLPQTHVTALGYNKTDLTCLFPSHSTATSSANLPFVQLDRLASRFILLVALILPSIQEYDPTCHGRARYRC